MSEIQKTKNDLRTKPILIESELKSSFLDYAMSVVVSSAMIRSKT